MAVNEQKKQILFAECKWQDDVNAAEITKELSAKAQYVEWNKDAREEYYIIFAKSFSKKIKEWQGKEVRCYDLKEIEKCISK